MSQVRVVPSEVGAGAKVVVVHGDRSGPEATELVAVLERDDYHCASYATSEEAIENCEPTLLGAAIISLDLAGDSAIALGRRLKELAGERVFLPVIVVGDADRIAREVRDFDGACDDFVARPVSPDEFSVRVATLIRRSQVQAELLRANSELVREQERRRALAGLMVHDLRNPLSAIVGNVQLLDEFLPPSDDPMVAQCLSDLGELSEKTLSMVAGLLDVEELEDGVMETNREKVDVHGLVSRMPNFYKTATEARRLEFQVNCPEGVHASFDRQLIARIFENLLDNAVRYAPRKGRVALNVLVEDKDLIVEVGNDGPAIPKDEGDQIFERYYRVGNLRKSARGHRGLGLYFCRLAATAHQGTISVAERPELPACFVLRLPECVN